MSKIGVVFWHIHIHLNLYNWTQIQAMLVEFPPQTSASPEQDSLPIVYAETSLN